ncbi:MAG: IS1 family transposase, partial [Nitrospirae bacterium]|nr:IS1 family transposase [Nitrospirota bacterium]
MNCPKCKSERNVKNGIVHRQQRYKCKECGCNFTKSKKKGYSMRTKIIALALYLSGVSMTMTGKIIGV